MQDVELLRRFIVNWECLKSHQSTADQYMQLSSDSEDKNIFINALVKQSQSNFSGRYPPLCPKITVGYAELGHLHESQDIATFHPMSANSFMFNCSMLFIMNKEKLQSFDNLPDLKVCFASR